MSISILLKDCFNECGIVLDDVVCNKLQQYIFVLSKWNQHFSLTSSSKHDAILKHIIDAHYLVKYLSTKTDIRNILDIGCGMGVPGIVCALFLPQVPFVLLDKSNKKTVFLKQIAIELELHNVDVTCCDINLYSSATEILITRAFGQITVLLDALTRLSSQQLLIMTTMNVLQSQYSSLLNEYDVCVSKIDSSEKIILVVKDQKILTNSDC